MKLNLQQQVLVISNNKEINNKIGKIVSINKDEFKAEVFINDLENIYYLDFKSLRNPNTSKYLPKNKEELFKLILNEKTHKKAIVETIRTLRDQESIVLNLPPNGIEEISRKGLYEFIQKDTSSRNDIVELIENLIKNGKIIIE